MEVTVVVPTSGRAGYLEVTLDSLRGQRSAVAHELLVVDDGSTDATPDVAERYGARLVRHGERRSLNAARNTGLREAGGELIAFVDDDVFVPPGWLDALAEGARRHPDADAFGGSERVVPRRDRTAGIGPAAIELAVHLADEPEGVLVVPEPHVQPVLLDAAVDAAAARRLAAETPAALGITSRNAMSLPEASMPALKL